MEEISKIKKFAKINSVPIMKDEGIDFICDYIVKNNVKSILEIGTGIGYSSIRFARAKDDVFVSTIEFDIERYHEAVKNVADNNLMDRILVYLGDAASFTFDRKFDLIFIDGPKAQYQKFFEHFQDNLSEKGVFISDNLSFHGMVDDLSLTHNYSTIKLVKKIRKYIDFLKTNKNFETEFLSLGDGIAITKRKK
jgi:predicted O-methyltransferase YrrM